jgi:hypothetical protein
MMMQKNFRRFDKMKKIFFPFTLFLFFSISILPLTQTGTLVVNVFTEDHISLPDATLDLACDGIDDLVIPAVSNRGGRAIYRRLQPGKYNLTIKSQGFKTTEVKNIAISIEKTTSIEVILYLENIAESMEIRGTNPLLETSSSALGYRFDFETYIDKTSFRRHYTALASLAGGTLRGNNPSVYGGGQTENLYLLDGLNINDPQTRGWGNQFNIDIIEEASLQAAGMSAEYGNITGSVFNIVTKSGTNFIKGLVRFEMTRANWSDLTINDPDRNDDDIREGADEDRLEMSGGGPILPDYIWWYAGYSSTEKLSGYQRKLNPLDPGELTPAVKSYKGHQLSVKGTFNPSPDIRLSILYLEDPMATFNDGSYYEYDNKLQPSADGRATEGGESYLASASFAISERNFIELRWAKNHANYDFLPQEADPDGQWSASTTEGPTYYSADGWRWGSIPDEIKSDRNRILYSVSLNTLAGEISAAHDIKLGVEYSDEWIISRDTLYPSGEFIETGAAQSTGFELAPYENRYVITNRLPEAENSLNYLSLYIQDAAPITDNLTVNIGLRSDISSGKNNMNREIMNASLLDTLAPRLGIVYSFGEHSAVFSAGRYYDMFPFKLASAFNIFDTYETWESYVPADGLDGKNGWVLDKTWTVGDASVPDTIDDNLTPSYMDEITLGLNFQLTDSIGITADGIWRAYRDLIIAQDMDGDHIYNYENLQTDAYGSKWKEYVGLTIGIRKRATDDNLFLAAFVTFSNVEGLANHPFDIGDYGSNPLQRYDNAEEWWGPVSTMKGSIKSDADPTFQIKAQAVYIFPNGWYIGALANLDNNYLPSSYDRVTVGGEKFTVFPNGRGDMERLGFFTDIDIQVGFEQEIDLPDIARLFDESGKIGIYAAIDNLLNEQSASGVETYIKSSNYSDPIKWRSAREYILGLKLEL